MKWPTSRRRKLVIIAAVALVSLVAVVVWNAARPAHSDPAPDGLYTDAQVRALAGYDIDATRGARTVFDIPCLDVVPSGSTLPRREVFRALNLDEGRVAEFRLTGVERVEFLAWRVSPSYDLVCMSSADESWEKGVAADDPARRVYGIRLVRRPGPLFW